MEDGDKGVRVRVCVCEGDSSIAASYINVVRYLLRTSCKCPPPPPECEGSGNSDRRRGVTRAGGHLDARVRLDLVDGCGQLLELVGADVGAVRETCRGMQGVWLGVRWGGGRQGYWEGDDLKQASTE